MSVFHYYIRYPKHTSGKLVGVCSFAMGAIVLAQYALYHFMEQSADNVQKVKTINHIINIVNKSCIFARSCLNVFRCT